MCTWCDALMYATFPSFFFYIWGRERYSSHECNDNNLKEMCCPLQAMELKLTWRRFVRLEDTGGPPAAAGAIPTHVNSNGHICNIVRNKVDNEVHMRRISSQQEIQMRSKGYVGIAGDYYTIERVPASMDTPRSTNRPRPAGPGTNFGGDMFPYQSSANNQYAVESILHKLIELCNSRTINTQ